jgi:hypothetical protein
MRATFLEISFRRFARWLRPDGRTMSLSRGFLEPGAKIKQTLCHNRENHNLSGPQLKPDIHHMSQGCRRPCQQECEEYFAFF